MGVFFVYILKSSACLAGFYLFYRLLLSKETFHRFNRIALLALLLLSLLLPLIQLTTTQQTEMHQTMLTIEQLLMMADMLPPKNSITNATPRLAPELVPKIDGPASGFLKAVCNISPQTASAPPQNNAVKA